MPDLMTHTLLGLILNKIVKSKTYLQNKTNIKEPSKEMEDISEGINTNTYFINNYLLFFLLGNIIPDIFSRIPMILYPKYIPFFDTYHTLIGGFFISYILSLLFTIPSRKNIFIFLFSGTVFHQLFDLFQKNIFSSGYNIFFPLDIKINIGFLWPEDSIYILPFLFILCLYIYKETISKYLNNK